MERDPVCGMELRPGMEEATFVYQDQTHRFCSTECRDRFQANPKHFLKEMQSQEAQA
jgi:YHS domain-containing protein